MAPTDRKVLSEIWVYPIKSLPGIRVGKANVLGKGLEGDRRLMLVDENNQFMTQRTFPQMALFDVSMESHSIRVRSKSNDSLNPLIIGGNYQSAGSFKAIIWNDEIEVMEVQPAFSKWFSETLNVTCKLVYFPEENSRRIDPDYVKEDSHVSLADGYPYLIIGENALRDLNGRVGQDLSLKRFRPNFVFDGGAPYEEDEWQHFEIGTVRFLGVKPCGRCSIPTVDPETGIKGDEPLRTLATYRKNNGKIYFGQNVIALNNGEINEGDEIHF